MRTNRRGFTLVELLVVIGIISILIAMLLPALNKARQSAQSVQCLSNLKQLSMACIMYAQENHDWLPPCWYKPASPTWGQTIPVELLKYGIKASNGNYRCPSETDPIMDNLKVSDIGVKNVEGPYSYAYNGYCGNTYSSPIKAYSPAKLTWQKDSYLMVLFVDCINGRNTVQTQNLHASYIPYGTSTKAGRHPNKSVNVALADGHAQPVTYAMTANSPDEIHFYLVPRRP